MPVGTTDSASDPLDATFAAAMAELAIDPEASASDSDVLQEEPDGSDAPTAQPAPDPSSSPVGDGDPAVPSTASVADPSSAPDTTPDPLAGAEPFTYVVDGQSRTMDGVYRIPNEGIIVPEEQVPKWQLMASRFEVLDRQNQELHQRTQDYERLSAWTSKDPTGKDITLTGRDAMAAARVDFARSQAALNTLVTIFRENPLELLNVDGQGGVTWNQATLNHLLTRANLAELQAEQHARTQFHTRASEPVQSPSIDIQQSAPVLVEHFIQQANISGLTTKDKAHLQAILPNFVRPTTPADIQANPALSKEPSVVDAAFFHELQHLAEIRADAAKVAQTSEQAGKFNRGQQQGRKAPVTPLKPSSSPQPDPAKKTSRNELWDNVFQQAMAEINLP